MNSRLEKHKVGLRRLNAETGGTMRDTYTWLYVHCVWGTWDRLPLLSAERKAAIYDCIQAECTALKSEVIAIGGIENHVHVLARIPATLSVAELVKQIKGASSHLVTHQLSPGEFFKWQGAYAAFPCRKRKCRVFATIFSGRKNTIATERLIPTAN